MKTPASRKSKNPPETDDSWPRKVQPGRAVVTVYKRIMRPSGRVGFMVSNYSDGQRRRFDSYPTEAEALEAAERLAKRLDACDYVAANLTRDQAIEYANSATRLKPFNVSVDAATASMVECLKAAGTLPNVHEAVKFWAERHRQITPKRVSEVVDDLIAQREADGASHRYLGDLRYRLGRFAQDFAMDIGSVTTSQLQEWLDAQKLARQSYLNFKTVLHLLFEFAVTRNHAVDNPTDRLEKRKVRGRDVPIYTPSEIARLLAAASQDFLPCLAIAAFAGLRSAEIERLDWSDVDMAERLITLSAAKTKTAARRNVPIHDNLAEWLLPYAGRHGKVWPHSAVGLYKAQEATAAATAVAADEAKGIKAHPGVAWKKNAARHSYASYRLAQLNDAGRVSGELGNTAAVVFRHYHQLVKPADAEAWFNVRPDVPATNVVPLHQAASV